MMFYLLLLLHGLVVAIILQPLMRAGQASEQLPSPMLSRDLAVLERMQQELLTSYAVYQDKIGDAESADKGWPTLKAELEARYIMLARRIDVLRLMPGQQKGE